MALIPAKCTECGGLIEVDNEKRLGICQYCGEPFIIEEAINTFNTYYNTTNNYSTTNNYGDGAVVNVYEDTSKNFVIEGGVLKKYQGASVDVVIPDGVVVIDNGCFKDLQIKSVSIPDSVKGIGRDAFSGCSSLTSVTIPASVKKIGSYAFNGCTSLGAVYITDLAAWCSIHFDDETSNPLFFATNLYLNNKLVTDLVIPYGITSIGQFAFSGCKSLTSVTIPASVTQMGVDVFEGCTGLKIAIINSDADFGAFINSTIEKVVFGDGVTRIGESAFRECTRITSVTIPNSVTSIGRCAFQYCINLTDLTIPNSVIDIGWSAFPAYWKSKGLCSICGGEFKSGFFSTKCRKCGHEKNY